MCNTKLALDNLALLLKFVAYLSADEKGIFNNEISVFIGGDRVTEELCNKINPICSMFSLLQNRLWPRYEENAGSALNDYET